MTHDRMSPRPNSQFRPLIKNLVLLNLTGKNTTLSQPVCSISIYACLKWDFLLPLRWFSGALGSAWELFCPSFLFLFNLLVKGFTRKRITPALQTISCPVKMFWRVLVSSKLFSMFLYIMKHYYQLHCHTSTVVTIVPQLCSMRFTLICPNVVRSVFLILQRENPVPIDPDLMSFHSYTLNSLFFILSQTTPDPIPSSPSSPTNQHVSGMSQASLYLSTKNNGQLSPPTGNGSDNNGSSNNNNPWFIPK